MPRPLPLIVLAILALSSGAAIGGAPVPTSASGIGPGSWIVTQIEGESYTCTANWLWSDGARVYLGAAGHCFLPEGKTSTHGAGADFDATDVRVRACVRACPWVGSGGGLLSGGDFVDLGPVTYARQSRGTSQLGQDFGLVLVPDPLHHLLRADVPVWGAISGSRDMRPAETVCHYGHGVATGETLATKARAGVAIDTLRDGSWRAALVASPGDSGSAVASCVAMLDGSVRAGSAVGILTHITPTGVGGTTMARAQQLAREAGLTIAPILG